MVSRQFAKFLTGLELYLLGSAGYPPRYSRPPEDTISPCQQTPRPSPAVLQMCHTRLHLGHGYCNRHATSGIPSEQPTRHRQPDHQQRLRQSFVASLSRPEEATLERCQSAPERRRVIGRSDKLPWYSLECSPRYLEKPSAHI
jgi:hypothetical protein